MLDINQYPLMNPTFSVTETEASSTTATIVIEPLEQGYGHTLGNALRRVLLSSLPGHAITSIRITGIDHQYTSLAGVSEDALELILNLKQIRIKTDATQPFTMRLKAKGPAQVKADSVITELGATIVNSDLPLATLAKGSNLEVEMKVEPGMGYTMASEESGQVIGDIPVDALFSPVIKVSYRIEATRVGRRTDFDRIVMQVQTDGTISPIVAMTQSARILAKQFTQVFDPTLPVPEEPTLPISPEEAEVLRLTVEELDLPTRIANALRKGGFKNVGDLKGAPKMAVAKVKNLGEKSVDVINEALQKKGVSLGE